MTSLYPQPSHYVVQLGPNDVLLGRGSGPNDHEGNVKFRQYVAERKQAYMATNHRLTKTKIAREIVHLVANAGGRFLKKIDESPEQEVYEIVSDDTVMEKAKQALRQNAGKLLVKQDNTGSKGGGGASSFGETRPKTTPSVLSAVLPENFDLEPLPFSDTGFSATMPSTVQSAASPQLWQQQNHKQAVADYQQRQQQQQQQRRTYEEPYEPYHVAATAGGQQPYPYHLQPQQQQRHMPPPQMRMPSPQEQQQQHHQQQQQQPLYSSAYPSSDDTTTNNTPSIVSSEGSSTSSQQQQVARRRGKRESLTIADLSQARNTMAEMTDSFSKLSAGDSQNKMMASSDTMGTIDYNGSMADMSINSSTFSIFRGGADSSSVLDITTPPPARQHNAYVQQQLQQRMAAVEDDEDHQRVLNNPRTDSSNSTKTKDSAMSGDSMSFTELFDIRGKSSSLSCSMGGLISDIRKQVETEQQQAAATLPTTRPLGGTSVDPLDVSTMRASSLDIVKALLPTDSESTVREEIATSTDQQKQPPAASHQRQAYYRQDPNRRTSGGV